MRRAMVLRMPSCGISSNEPSGKSFLMASSDAGVGAGALAAGASADFAAGADACLAPPEALAPSTSAFVTRPCGPEPETAERSIPASLASRRASGEANTRSPLSWPFEADLASDLGSGLDSVFGAPSDFGASALASDLGASALAGSASAFALPASFSALSSSPSPSRIAISSLTGTSAVPSATRILATLPSSTASTSMVALSVSISAMTSPDLTSSPSFTSHLARLPFSMVGERAGIRMLVGIGLQASSEGFWGVSNGKRSSRRKQTAWKGRTASRSA